MCHPDNEYLFPELSNEVIACKHLLMIFSIASPCATERTLISVKKPCVGNLISGDRVRRMVTLQGYWPDGDTRSLLGCQKCSVFLRGGSMCIYCVKSHCVVPLRHMCFSVYMWIYASAKIKWRKRRKHMHASFPDHIAQEVVSWPLLLNNGGSRLSDFPKVTQIARGRVKMQSHVLIAKAVLFQLQDQGLSGADSALDDLWLRTRSATGMLGLLVFWYGWLLGPWGQSPLHRSKVSSLIKSKEKSKPGTRQDRNQESD